MGTASLRNRLDIFVVGGLAFIHGLALFAVVPAWFSWSGFFWFIALFYVTGTGITLCYHRLLTHNSFKTYAWFRYLLVVIATIAWEGRPILWVGRHREHHGHSDKEGDPHSPRDGITWAHVTWVCWKNPEGDARALATVKGDLLQDRGLVLIDKFFWVAQVLLGIGLFVGGLLIENATLGWSWVVWGVGVRTMVVYHVTWSINSFTHMYGYRNFEETGDNSRNNWIFGLLGYGEGWHNNHHAEPTSAAHGRRWYEIDLTYGIILLLEKIGLVWGVVRPKKPLPDKSSSRAHTAQGESRRRHTLPRRASAKV